MGYYLAYVYGYISEKITFLIFLNNALIALLLVWTYNWRFYVFSLRMNFVGFGAWVEVVVFHFYSSSGYYLALFSYFYGRRLLRFLGVGVFFLLVLAGFLVWEELATHEIVVFFITLGFLLDLFLLWDPWDLEAPVRLKERGLIIFQLIFDFLLGQRFPLDFFLRLFLIYRLLI